MNTDAVHPRRTLVSLDSLQRLTRLLNLLALLACGGVVAYVVGNFVWEYLFPPAPAAHIFFGAEDGRRAVFLVSPALRWLARIIIWPAQVQLLAGALFCWRDRPCLWKLVGGTAMFLLSALFWLAGTLSCSCL